MRTFTSLGMKENWAIQECFLLAPVVVAVLPNVPYRLNAPLGILLDMDLLLLLRPSSWPYSFQVLGKKGQYFHLVTIPPPIFRKICREDGDTPGAGWENCLGALFPNLSYF